ncbi:MAG TPA: ABC transporter ATP-binding protein, partial [Methylophaga aminisulfidivorans]|nr:ABC transporter ATP-binding protein [Methylophaga aminisulfidivorans]
LDLEMRLALTVALQDFEGALVVVSHDRHLLRTVTDDLWLVSNQQAVEFDGDLDDYRQWLLTKDKPEKTSTGISTPNNKKQDRQAAAEQRKKMQPLRNAVKKAEQLMDKANEKLADLEQQLADTALYTDANKDKLKALLQQQGDLKTQLEQAEMDWFESSEQLEAAEAAEE